MSDEFRVIAPLAYAGKSGCEDVRCTRTVGRDENGNYVAGECRGWHCSYCDQPCSSMGHRCDAAEAVIGEARRAAEE